MTRPRIDRHLALAGLLALALMLTASAIAPLAGASELSPSTVDETTESVTSTTTEPSPEPTSTDTSADETDETLDGAATDLTEATDDVATDDLAGDDLTDVIEDPTDPVVNDVEDALSSLTAAADDTLDGDATGDDGQEPAEDEGGESPAESTGDETGSTDSDATPQEEAAPASAPGDGPSDAAGVTSASAAGSTAPEVDEDERTVAPPEPFEHGYDRLKGVLAEEQGEFVVYVATPPAPSVVLPAPVLGPQQTEFSVSGYQPRGGARSTSDILELLGDADAATVVDVLAPFPVAGHASYGEDWHALRDGGARLHKGTDIFAARGTPVIASSDGVITHLWPDSELGGTALKLTGEDGTYFYYAHLDRFVDGMQRGMQVEVGQVLGYVGNTGNAILTPPHLHYQIHPFGGAAVPPVPYLDAWLESAMAAANQLVAQPPPVQITMSPPATSSPAASSTAPTAASAAGPAGLPDQIPSSADTGHDLLGSALLWLMGTALLLTKVRGRRGRRAAQLGPTGGPSVPPIPDVLAPVLDAATPQPAAGASASPDTQDVLAPVLAHARQGEPLARRGQGRRLVAASRGR